MFRTQMTLDPLFRTLTIVFGSLCGAMAVFALTTRTGAGYFGCFLAVGVLGFAWAMSPRAVTVAGGELLVERRAWTPVRVPVRTIQAVTSLDRMGKGVRVFGVGGLFGSYGLFANDTLGRFHLYATRRGPAVIVRRNDALPIVLTPDNVIGTIEAIEQSKVGGSSRWGVA
jgi:hypothetical protein